MTDYVAPQHQLQNGRALKFFKQYWLIIGIIFGAGVIYSEIRAEAVANAIINEQQQAAIMSNTEEINLLDKRYIEDITFIKAKLEQLFEYRNTQSRYNGLVPLSTP